MCPQTEASRRLRSDRSEATRVAAAIFAHGVVIVAGERKTLVVSRIQVWRVAEVYGGSDLRPPALRGNLLACPLHLLRVHGPSQEGGSPTDVGAADACARRPPRNGSDRCDT